MIDRKNEGVCGDFVVIDRKNEGLKVSFFIVLI